MRQTALVPFPKSRSGSPATRLLREVALLVVTAIVIAVGVKSFVAQAFYIPSGSMIPQLAVNDRVVVSKLAYRLHDPRRGDIIVFDAPNPAPEPERSLPDKVIRGIVQSVGLSPPSTKEFIKRVIALPGERVEGRDGHVYIDGRLLVEPYLPPGMATSDFGSRTIDPDHLWVMGDNRGNSSDSRVFGPIRRDTVVGRALVRVWPPGRTAFL